jgi:AraC-like DNA-binding protein
LNKAYRALVEKNIENLELRDSHSREHLQNVPYQDNDGKLLARILQVMEETEVICDPNFSIIKLALLVEANNTYVSQVINNAMRKNFRALLNEYRVREAQRLLSKSDAVKYTIESISLQLGYKSPNTFRAAFQDITGVSPSFYLKSLREIHE